MSKRVILASIGVVIALGWLLIVMIQPNGPTSLISQLKVGLIIGTMFGQASLAAAWCAFGPLTLTQRLPLSFCWLAIVVVAFGVNVASSQSTTGLSVVLMYGALLLIQWLIAQVPMWLFVTRYGAKIVFGAGNSSQNRLGDQQFRIREVMILTTIVAVVLGVSRLMLGGLKTDSGWQDWKFLVFFVVLLLVNSVVSLLIILAAFFYRARAATVIAMLLAVCATVFELPVMMLIDSGPAAYNLWVILNVNLFHCAWILSIALLLKRADFRLNLRPSC